MVVGHCLQSKKSQTCGCSMQWTQYTMDAVDTVDAMDTVDAVDTEDAVGSGHSGHNVHSEIVVYGSGDIVFGAKMPNKWTQWTQ